MLAAMGCELQIVDGKIRMAPGEQLQAIDAAVPGDFSSAAFLIVAATLTPGSEVRIEGVGVNPTRTGLLDVLEAMGADLILDHERSVGGEPVADLTICASELHGVEVGGDMVVRMIDEFPALAVAATQAQGETVVRDATELRVKETDRIATTAQELRRLGAEIEARPDGFALRGPIQLKGAVTHSHGDHRLAMALAVAGLVAHGETVVQNTDCIADSFPGFAEILGRLKGHKP
jgi:3-phosphoshikimate 1-carboxyvinyltransferase